MDKELIDKAWRCLPREFREEVKKIYKTQYLRVERIALLCNLFGAHNLTSDAEGEDEMLYVSRKQVQEYYKYYHTERDNEEKGSVNRFSLSARIAMLEELFGSKCLPDDNEDNFVSKEPKYRVNDKVICGVLADRKECIIVHYNINTKEYRLRVIEDGTTIHRSEEFIYGFAPNEPKPAEPKFKVGDEVVEQRIQRRWYTSVSAFAAAIVQAAAPQPQPQPQYVAPAPPPPYTAPAANCGDDLPF